MEYDFTVVNQLKAIKDASVAGSNQVTFKKALDEAGITYADETKLVEYMAAIVTSKIDGKAIDIETLADIQAIIDEVDTEAVEDAENAAKVKAVVDAKTQPQLLTALTANFDGVNPEWIVEYAETEEVISGTELLAITKDTTGVDALEAETIQDAIYTVNYPEINKVSPTTLAEQAKKTALIEKWMTPDVEGVKTKAEAVQASKVLEAKFRVKEAKSPNTLYSALENYIKVIADEETPELKTADLNANLKAFYFAELDNYVVASSNAKTIIVDKADVAAREAAMKDIKTAYTEINEEEAKLEGKGEATAAQKAALKKALQDLANYTSHLTGDAKFDMSIVKDANLVAYAAQFAESEAIVEASAVTAVVSDVNTVNENAAELAFVKVIKTSTDTTEIKNALIGLANIDGKLTNFLTIDRNDRGFVAETIAKDTDTDKKEWTETEINSYVGTIQSEVIVKVIAADTDSGVNSLTKVYNENEVITVLENFEAFDKLGTLDKQDKAAEFHALLSFVDAAGEPTAKVSPAFKSYTAVKALVDSVVK